MKFESTDRQIRSFVLRKGKMTVGQKKAVEELMPVFAFDPKEKIDFTTLFGNDHPVWLDIGFGNGESIIHAAQKYPEVNFLGIEVHLPGVGHLLMAIKEFNLKNVRIIRNDAVDMLNLFIQDHSLSAIHVYFPDPWHKKRHHKRRIMSQEFLDLIRPKLRPSGRLHYASDWEPYAIEVQALLAENSWLTNQQPDNGFADRPDWRPITKFERRGIKLDHGTYDLIMTKT
ncbi:tRNA (guanosine(46)-N7)-methyltransferase TrmB [Marinicella litoralis]|uniref:tRNA (guanine-N(7)-)-methyltransferase n=1 Tax=Marinicella litoralis TaxID=644220 RepID=A0A4R6XS40_9GAMM|nr:tRNA (guanosine(46)-N7)-methyltransferase TrmB [Marinicella litoralis]TDR22742.1 tRNA (guanine-N(7)-)-methyltransferase [Marinicella litoralis]